MVETAPADIRVSVCMAAYNGAAFIEDQIESILAQLGESDELVIIDDCSKDNTVELVASIHDSRIHLSSTPSNVGYVRTFNRALDKARGSYILLSDQDDLWADGRLDAMVAALATSNVVAGNLEIIGTGGRRTPSPLTAAQSTQHVRNILGIFADRRGYWGCAMGIRREFLRVATPFPRPLYESHDLWTALLGNASGSITHLEQTVTLRREHGGNATPTSRRGIVPAVRGRIMLFRCLLIGLRRLARTRQTRAA